MTKRPDVTAALTALGPLPETVRLVSIDHTKNRQRFYSIARQQNLWDEGVLVQRWGRLGTQGRSRIQCFADALQVERIMTQLLRRRLQHGYQVVRHGERMSSERQPARAEPQLPYSLRA